MPVNQLYPDWVGNTLGTLGTLGAVRTAPLGGVAPTLANLGQGRTLRGSWYSQAPGWVDKEDKPGSNALGVPDAMQGIALPTRKTLGNWFMVTDPEGRTHRLQQTDIGPAGWTGRGVDISAAAAARMGYTPGTFPTDANFKVAPADGEGSPWDSAPRGVPYAQTATPVGPEAAGGWEQSVGASPAGVGYVNPEQVGQGATTDPRELVRDKGFDIGAFLANFDFKPAPVPQQAPFQFGKPAFAMAQLGRQKRG